MNPQCGTPRGYRAHRKLGQKTCPDCLLVEANKRRKYSGMPPLTDTPMTATELIHEIERLLSYGEGEHAILKAAGYLNKPKNLKTRLYHHGRQDLNERIFWKEAA